MGSWKQIVEFKGVEWRKFMQFSIDKFFIALVAAIVIILLIFASSTSKVVLVKDNEITRIVSVLERSDLEGIRNCEFSPSDGFQCPSYFAWIEKDLAPWKTTGISQEDIQGIKERADFRVVIVNGTLYMERYHKCFESRDDLTVWGLLMLLQEYPGMIPDLEMMVNCGDFPLVPRFEYKPHTEKWPPTPVFVYCTTTHLEHYDILLPDWSFWGWPEVNIAPWYIEKEKVYKGAAETEWSKREPIAHWKGNYHMGPARADLVKCTVNNTNNYSLVTYHQDWFTERDNHFNSSALSKQCMHRYKVYVEGGGWSVSRKYIFACGSTVLQIKPIFQEFFARSMIPFVHYWPVNRSDICNSIKHAVDWGNANPQEAEAIGKCGQSFTDKEISMDYVYQYMLYLLRGYADLLTFKPVPPPGMEPMTLESFLPGHELTIPSRNKSEMNLARGLCSLPQISADELHEKVIRGYERQVINL